MAKRSNFSATEWNTLRDTPYLVGFAVLLAGSGGIGTLSELIALSEEGIEHQSSTVALLCDLSTKEESGKAQASVRQSFRAAHGTPPSDTVRRHALDQARSSMAILITKADKDETDAYRRMLYAIAEDIRATAHEKGFFASSEHQSSESQQLFLDQLRNILQIEQVKRA